MTAEKDNVSTASSDLHNKERVRLLCVDVNTDM